MTIRLKGVDNDDNALINALIKELKDRQKRNHLRACFYDGKRAVKFVGTVIPPQYHRLGLVLGWTAKAVDILARRCNLDGFVWPEGDLKALGYQDVFDANRMATEASSATVSSLIHGPSFLINTEGGKGEPKALIHTKDAMNATGQWNPRRRGMDNLLSIHEWDEQDPKSLTLYLDGRTITAEKDSSGWTAQTTEHTWGVPVELLPYKPRVGRPFGSSRISRPVMALQDEALRAIIRLEGHSDVFSFPEMWMLGADESIFKNPDGTIKPHWQVMLGRIKGIPDDDDAAVPRAELFQTQPASPEHHLNMITKFAQLFCGETSIPMASLGVADLNNPTSADSYIASREDLIAEAEGATDDWSPGFQRGMARALAMANDETSIPAEFASIAPKWRSPVFLSRAAQADAGAKQLGAVPWLAQTEVGLELLGLDDQQIKRAMSEKRRLAGTGVLQQLTAAAQARNAAPATPVAQSDAESA